MAIVKKLGFLWSFSLLAVILGGYYVNDMRWTWAGSFYVYLIVPLLDVLIGKDRSNVSHERYESTLNDPYFSILLYLFVYLQYALLLWGCYILITDSLTMAQQIHLIVNIGLFAGTIINVAHELGHRSSQIAQFHAKMALLSVSYMHFFIEHNRGHHVHVATPEDSATAHKNQTLYAFWWQTVRGSYRSAWRIEAKSLTKVGQPVWSRQNQMIWFTLLPFLLCLMLTSGFSLWAGYLTWNVPVFFATQSLVAVLLLESINYIEHYGIVRRQISGRPGQPMRYERVNPLHSWNASQLVSNLVLFQLQRHSDHHAYASRPYQVLRHFDESPQLPGGYPLMILLAFVPPLWFALMNPRLERWQTRACQPEEIAALVKQFA
ncbi:alkane 1-monooxygenase [Spirosoma areae]